LDQKRSFDIAVRHHAEPAQNNPLLAAADYVLTGGFSKFHSASQFLKLPQLHKAYSGYLFLDGDVEFEPGAIDRLFAIASLLKLDLAQAALTTDSFSSWPVTRASEKFVCRQTSFVEVMAPYLSSDALDRVLPTFDQSISGYGLDFAWACILKRQRIGIIDDVRMRHTKPVDKTAGSFYLYLKSIGVDPDAEQAMMFERFGISRLERPHDVAGYMLPDPEIRVELLRVPLLQLPRIVARFMRWQDSLACLLARSLAGNQVIKLPHPLP